MHVAFYRRLAYGAFVPEMGISAGGAERRSLMFAEGMAKYPDVQVTYVVGKYGPPPAPRHGGLAVVQEPYRIHSIFDMAYQRFSALGGERSSHFPWVRWRRWHAGLLWQLPLLAYDHLILRQLPTRWRIRPPQARRFFQSLGCDVFCIFGAGNGAADVVASCRAAGIKTVLFLVHDDELKARPNPQEYVRRLGDYASRLRFVLENVDAIVAQTAAQQQTLLANYRRSATLLRNPIDTSVPPVAENPAAPRHVLWIGRAENASIPHKRPEFFWALAAACPEIPFLAVANNVDENRFQSLMAEKPPNLTVVERVPQGEIGALYQQASVFVSTADAEGFPNTFLEAARYSVPIVSLNVDPDGFLSDAGAGICCQGDRQKMFEAVQSLWQDRELAARFAAAARRYIEREHNVERQVASLKNLLDELTRTELERAPRR